MAKNHGCFVCGRKFSVKSNLTRHMRTHTKKRSLISKVTKKRKKVKTC